MKPILFRTTLVFAMGCALHGQSFEVASVKPSHAPEVREHAGPRNSVEHTPGGLSMRNVSLQFAIQYAYKLKEYQVTGPGWISSDRYDIVAKAPGAVAESDLRLMLKSLLAERFKLQVHSDSKEMPVYVLVEAKGGHKMQESEAEGDHYTLKGNRMNATVRNASMSELVDLMYGPLQRPVLDQTGLTKRYDFSVDMTGLIVPDMQPDDMLNLLAKVLQDQLGLKMEPKKAKIELLIVDHAEKIPTEN